MNAWVSLSPLPRAHPPRSNPFLRSSSDAPPFPCITPSTVTCVMVVSFMVAAPFWEGCRRRVIRQDRGADLIGRVARSPSAPETTAPVWVQRCKASPDVEIPSLDAHAVRDRSGDQSRLGARHGGRDQRLVARQPLLRPM